MNNYEKVEAMLQASQEIQTEGIQRVGDELHVIYSKEGQVFTVEFSGYEVARIAASYTD